MPPAEEPVLPPAPSRPSAFSALRWLLGASILQRLLGLVGLAAVARVVSEEGFGVFRALYSLHLVALVVMPLGLDQLVVREASRRTEYIQGLRSGVLTAMLVGALFVLFLSPVLPQWIGIGEYGDLLWLAPLILALQALKTAMKPVLVAEMAFRRIATGEFLTTIVLWFGGLGLTQWLPEPWAFAVAFAAGEAVEAWWLWRGRWKTSGPVSVSDLRRLLARHRRFCSVLTVDQGANTAGQQAPALLLGTLLGTAAVTAFSAGSFLIALPLWLMIGAIARIALPSLVGLEEAELRRRVLLTLRGSAAWIAPVLLWLGFFSGVVVAPILGPEWAEDAAPVVPWLVAYLVFQGLFSPISSLDILRDRPEATLVWNLVNLGLRALALWFGSRWGLVGAIATFSLLSAVMWLLYGVVLAWLLGAGQWTFHRAWLAYVPAWGALLAAWAACRWLAPNAWVGLALSPLPALLYLAGVLWKDREVGDLLRRLALPARARVTALSSGAA